MSRHMNDDVCIVHFINSDAFIHEQEGPLGSAAINTAAETLHFQPST